MAADTDRTPKGDGGNHQITNQNEAEILTATTQGLRVRTEGMQSPERH